MTDMFKQLAKQLAAPYIQHRPPPARTHPPYVPGPGLTKEELAAMDESLLAAFANRTAL